MTIKLQPLPNSKNTRIVGFEVEPRSFGEKVDISDDVNGSKFDVPLLNLNEMYKKGEWPEDRQFRFSYSIRTINDASTAWETRMDHFMKVGNENIHVAAILLSLGVIVTLSCLMLSLLKRGLNKDFVNILKQKISRD